MASMDHPSIWYPLIAGIAIVFIALLSEMERWVAALDVRPGSQ